MERYEAARDVVAQASTILELVEAGNLLAQFTDDEQTAAREYFNSLPAEVNQQFIGALQSAFAREAAIGRSCTKGRRKTRFQRSPPLTLRSRAQLS